MEEKRMFFNEEQKQLLAEIDELENVSDLIEICKDSLHSEGFPEKIFLGERKVLTVLDRMKIAENIQSKYSMLKKNKGIFHAQLFSAMDEYLKECHETGYKYGGL